MAGKTWYRNYDQNERFRQEPLHQSDARWNRPAGVRNENPTGNHQQAQQRTAGAPARYYNTHSASISFNPFQNPHQQSPFAIKSKFFKQHLLRTIDQNLYQIQQWYPDDALSSDDDDEMDWQPESELLIPQPAGDVSYVWDRVPCFLLDDRRRYPSPLPIMCMGKSSVNGAAVAAASVPRSEQADRGSAAAGPGGDGDGAARGGIQSHTGRKLDVIPDTASEVSQRMLPGDIVTPVIGNGEALLR